MAETRSGLIEPSAVPDAAIAARPDVGLEPGELQPFFPELEILDLLGSGGMGAVYRARQPRLDRSVALKILTCSPERLADFALRFEREAQTLAKLSHPNIVTIHDFGEREHLFYFLMEFVDGMDLGTLIHRSVLPPQQALKILHQVSAAMQYAHEEGVLHRDIKPANILIDSKGRVKIADFGLAKMTGNETDLLASGLTLTGTSMGTPHYMAPEQWESLQEVDHRADIYSLGVVFYEMLTGERPAGTFSPPSELRREVDARLDRVVSKAMQKNPDKRYQSASEIQIEVDRIAKTPTRRSRPGMTRRLGTAAAAITAMGFAIFALYPDSTEPQQVQETQTVATPSSATRPADTASNPAPSPAADRHPGRLRGAGTFLNGKPLLLERAAEFNDIVDVKSGSGEWVALRANGETVASNPSWEATGIRGIADTIANTYFAVMPGEGGMIFFGNGGRLDGIDAPVENQRIIDAAVHTQHGLALTEGQRAIHWGSRYEQANGDPNDPGGYGTPAWPPPPSEALTKIIDVAITVTSAATLQEDGRLFVWNWLGMLEPNLPSGVNGFVKVESTPDNLLVEDRDGGIWALQVARNPTAGSAARHPRFKKLGEGSLKSKGFWVNRRGEWRYDGRNDSELLEIMLEEENLNAETVVHGKEAFDWHNSEERTGFLLWIEPAGLARADSHPVDELGEALHKGRLRGEGVRYFGQPIDLSKAAGIEDFVEVILDTWGWVGLRDNGEVIHSEWGPRPESNVKRLLTGLFSWGMIDDDGRLTIVGRSSEGDGLDGGISMGVLAVPEEFQRIGVVDAAWSSGIAIARLRDGSAQVWGERYETTFANQERWPRPAPEALTSVLDTAISRDGCASLGTDGKLHLWGADFLQSEFELMDGEVMDLESGPTEIRVLLADGRLFALLGKHGQEGKLIAEGVDQIAGYRILRSGAEQWEHLHPSIDINPFLSDALKQVPRLARRHFDAAPRRPKKGAEPNAGVIWIEAADANKASKDDPAPSLATDPTNPGTVSGWGNLPFVDEAVEALASVDDAVSLAVSHRDWIVLRSDGTTLSNRQEFDQRNSVRWIDPACRAVVFEDGVVVWREEAMYRPLLPARFKPVAKVFLPAPDARHPFIGIALHQDGTLTAFNADSPSEDMEKGREIALERVQSAIGSIEDAIDLVAWTPNGRAGVVRANGRVAILDCRLQSHSGLVEERDEWRSVENIQQLALMGTGAILGLTTEGSIINVDRTSKIPANLGQVSELIGEAGVAAARRSDGSWVAWGNLEEAAGLEHAIASLPATPVMAFTAETGFNQIALFWIANANDEATRATAEANGTAYPPDEAGFRQWLKGKVFQVTEHREGASHDDLFWIRHNQLHWLGVPRDEAEENERRSWDFDVSSAGEISWNWWGRDGPTHWIRILPNRERFVKTYRDGGTEAGVLDHGRVRTDLSAPGRLHAVGTDRRQQPVDLSKVDGFDDLIDVGGSSDDWVALRANGRTVSLSGTADLQNIRSIEWSFGQNLGFLDRHGRIVFPRGRVRELPTDFASESFVDLELGNEHGIALTEDGRAFVFGQRYREAVGDPAEPKWYGTPKWPTPPPDALIGVKAIAVTTTHAATLKQDGTLSVFGWEGDLLDLPPNPNLGRIESISSTPDAIQLLDAYGEVWHFPLPRNPAPGQPVAGGGQRLKRFSTSPGATRLRSMCWLDRNGMWRHPFKELESLLRQARVTGTTLFSNDIGLFEGQAFQSLLWIEPTPSVSEAAPNEAAVPASPTEPIQGRLQASGILASGNPIDLSRAEGVGDFIQVQLQSKGWVALRSNGQTLSSNGLGDREGVERLFPIGNGHFALLMKDGELDWVTGHPKQSVLPIANEVPEHLHEVGLVDLAGGEHQAIALLEDGSAVVWGNFYDHPELAPRWLELDAPWPRPPQDALERVRSIAASSSWAGTVSEDGRLQIWQRNGLVDLSQFATVQGQFTKVYSTNADIAEARLSDGRILLLNLTTGSHRLVNPAATRGVINQAYGGFRPLWQDKEGRWFSNWAARDLVEMVTPLTHLPPTAFSLLITFQGYGAGGEQIHIGLIRIEPVPSMRD